MEFEFVQRGSRLQIPNVDFHNAIIEVLRSQPQMLRSSVDQHSVATWEEQKYRRHVLVQMREDVDPYSIFTVDYAACDNGQGSCSFIGTSSADANSLNFDPRYPQAYARKIRNAGDAVFIANQQYGLGQEGRYLLNILGDEEPVLVKYDAQYGIPTVGDTVGPIPSTYLVGLTFSGLKVISGPDLQENRVWVIRSSTIFTLVELCLAEDHPGRGIVFDAYKGTWDKYVDGWVYDCETPLVKAIDWRYGVPYPTVGAKGLFTPRDSETYNIIYECVSLDCEALDGTCCSTGS